MSYHHTDKHGMRYYRCEICGKIKPWGDGWEWYGSYAEYEHDASRVKTVCGQACKALFDKTLPVVFPKKMRREQNGPAYVPVKKKPPEWDSLEWDSPEAGGVCAVCETVLDESETRCPQHK